MLRKLVLQVIIILILNPINSVFALSQPYQPPDSNLLGQNQYYSVFFRGNGETIVNFRTQFMNNTGNSISRLTYYLPDSTTINNLIVYQRFNSNKYPCYPIREPVPYGLDKDREVSNPSGAVIISPSETSPPNLTPEPAIAPCIDQPIFYNNGNFIKADYQLNGNVLRIQLPRTVYVSEYVNLVVSYRSRDFTKQVFSGSYNYSFSTFKTDSIIDSIQLGITAEQDYVLNEAKGKVRYMQNIQELVPPSASGMSTDNLSKEFDTYYNRIGQGAIYKYVSHLASLESYTVSGSYADSAWKLYFKQIIAGVLIIIASGLAVFILLRNILKSMFKSSDKKEYIKHSFWMKLSSSQKSIFISSVISILGATFTVIYTVFLFIFASSLERFFSFNNGIETVFFLLVIVLSFVVYIAFLFLPAIIISIKRDLIWGITAFILTIFWLVLYLVLVIILGATVFNNNPRAIDYPLSSGTETYNSITE